MMITKLGGAGGRFGDFVCGLCHLVDATNLQTTNFQDLTPKSGSLTIIRDSKHCTDASGHSGALLKGQF